MAIDKKTVTKLESTYMQQYDAYLERRKKRKKRLIRRLVLFSFIALLAIGSLTTYHIKQRVLQTEMEAEYERLEDHLASLKKEEKNLQEEVVLLNNEDYVLEIARTNYFFSKKGELIFKILDEKPSY